MHHLTLWLNMITFSVLVASGGLSFLRFLRIRAAWRKFYLAYLGSCAAWLLISQRTVETHIRYVYRKCNVGNRMELAQLVAKYRAG